MRLHRLEICGIGPFGERQVVDFDRLNEAGIFLLAGPTGSGKTSVLDAIAVALFGQAPGARQRGRDLVSHHRSPELAPEVRLEATLGSRRIRVTRSPGYLRPKKRGEGETEENPTVALEVLDAEGTWRPVSSRIAEADRQICEWLGMDASQFSQVVMLPQGEFATFLRADARDRRRLLERLFPSHDFAFVERWLRDHAVRAREKRDEMRGEIERRLAAAAAVASRVGSRETVAVAAGGAEDLGFDGDQPETAPPPDQPNQVRTWVDQLGTELARAADEALELQTAAKKRLDQAEGRRRAAEDQASQIERAERARRGALSEWNRLRAELEGARLPEEPDEFGAQAAREAERELRARVTELEAFEREGLARRTELGSSLQSLAAEVGEIEAEKSKLAAAQAEGPLRIKQLEEELREAESAAATLPGLQRVSASLAERQAAAKRRDGLAPQLEAAERAVAEERSLALADREHWLHLREARLAGIAAELAAQLEPGSACPVCGAEEHPHLAAATLDAPSKQDEEEAQASLAQRERAVEEARARLEALKQEHEHFDGRAEGGSVEVLAREHQEAERETRLFQAKANLCEGLTAQLAQLRESHAAAAGRLKDLEAKLARLGERHAEMQRQIEEIDRREDALRGDDPSVPARRMRLEATAEILAAAAEAAARAKDAVAARTTAEAIELELPLNEAVEAHGAALSRYEEATTRAATVQSQSQAFARETAGLPDLTDAFEPLAEAAGTAAELADLAQGKNAARLQLSTYVLAARLEQVIEAANLRLAPMSSGRYRLVYSAELAGRGAISGLGIRVLDAHTGLEREASSLSGGESFYASLSLALGLAEVVQRESGGRRLETLFIDEGFGSLDADTLDQVMAVLDDLRDGGRVIGLVSHVEELKTRIPTRVEVTPRPDGSSLSLVGA